MMNRVFQCLLCLLIWTVASIKPLAQENYMRFERLSSEKGVTLSVISSIVQDSRGFMWFATQGGLCRYDGYKLTMFKYNPNDSRSLPVNKVLAVFEGSHEKLWVGTDGGGLVSFERNKEFFTCYKYTNPADLFPDPGISNIRAIIEDKNGIIWIGTFGGLLRFNPAKNEWYRYYQKIDDPWGLNNSNVRSLCEDDKGWIWIGTQGGGVNVLDPSTNTFSVYTARTKTIDGLSSNDVWALAKDKNGIMWIGTELGLDRFDPLKKTFQHYENDLNNPDSLVQGRVRCLYVDRSNVLWAGTNNGLECLKSTDKKTFIHYRHQLDKPDSLSHNSVFSIYEDRANSIWVGTDGGGVNRLDRQKQQFGHYLGNPGEPGHLSSNEIAAIFEDNSGVLWVGTFTEGLNRLDTTTGKFTCYRSNKTDKDSLSSDEMTAIYQDHVGELWFGTWGGGINRLIPDKNKIKFAHYLYNDKNFSGPSSNKILCFSEDWDGDLWVGTSDGGANRYDRKRNEFFYYRHDPQASKSISGNIVTVIRKDIVNKAILWMGTYNSGLDRFNRNTQTFKHFTHIPENKNSISYNAVRAIYISPSEPDILWIGTFGGGLNRFDQKAKTWRAYTEEDGLPDNTICGILEDQSGMLWMSTTNGLSQFNPKTGEFNNYDVNDGLQANEFNQGACFKSKDGTFYFGGLNGYNVFNPQKLERNPYVPPIVITEFKIFNSAASLNQSIVETKEIHLKYTDSVLSFAFAALNYIGTSKNQYAYRMEGVDEQWIPLRDKREITFSRLSPGIYNFQVKGSNNDGVWNETGVSLRLIIAPPFWETLWFRLLLLLWVLGMIITTYKMRVRKYKRQREILRIEVLKSTQEIREQKQIIEDKGKLLEISIKELQKSEADLRELNATKVKFFSIISHDMRNQLGSLMGASDMLANQYQNLNEENRLKYSKAIDKYVNQLNDLLENLLQWARSQTGRLTCKPKKIKLNDIINETILFHAPNAKKKEIELTAMVNETDVAYADKDMVTFIFRNLISNAIKFTPTGGFIQVTTMDKGEWIVSSVIDSGVGITPEKAETLFSVGMNQSTKGTANEKGNGLGLVLCKEFVEKNGGSIWYEKPNAPKQQGSIFRFTLPKSEKKIVIPRLG